MRFVISTIGTSTLTNSINREDPDEARDWMRILGESANHKGDELSEEANNVIHTLAERAREKLNENNIKLYRQASAELNGIYGIYSGALPDSSKDQHYLICTDTAQGQTTGSLIKEFLERQGFTVVIETPKRLSAKDTESFTDGIKELIKWLEDNVPWRRDSGYEVIFNLVGGFKSLQGYMQTFGTFYADETVYIFERSADLIKIPKLPIQIDTTVIENHLVKFAMMAAGEMYPIEELNGISETLLEKADDHAGISAWGLLVWNRSKSDLLVAELLPFPRLEYQDSFHKDFTKEKENKRRLKLQEILAKVAFILSKDNGATSRLSTDGGLQYNRYTNVEGRIDHFRVDDGRRVSCQVAKNGLILRHYGTHDYVNNNP
ncbi:MAG: putative CRISPR-associated protein [Candidatus Poribacteria bacterium]|nr:putative CRISPR-associated protein [Candidatus Poribacteria bacterium]